MRFDAKLRNHKKTDEKTLPEVPEDVRKKDAQLPKLSR